MQRFNTNIVSTLRKTMKTTSFLAMMCFSTLRGQNGVSVIPGEDFNNGLSGWTLSKLGSSSATIALSDSSILSGINSAKVTIVNGGDSLASVRIKRSFNMEVGRYYAVSFMAVANRSCTIQPAFNANNSSINTIWRGPETSVTTAPQRFGPFSFRNLLGDASRAVSIMMGGQDSISIWIDSIVVMKSDDPENTRDDEAFVASFTETLNQLAQNSENKFLKQHFQSIVRVINDPYFLLVYNYGSLRGMSTAMTDTTTQWCPRNLASYLERKRPFIVSWTSPTDGGTSLAWVLPPTNWVPAQAYPLYIALHGLWTVADNPITYLTYDLSVDSVIHEPYDNGYLVLPWGRGNLWYEGISETDIWECISVVESLVHVNPARKYLTGHSMGGYGAWSIGQKSAGTWAAIGIHAGALFHDSLKIVTPTAFENLKNTPAYFTCGDQDDLLDVNQWVFQELQNAGNTNIAFTTFSGGHIYLYDNVNNIYQWIKTYSLGETNATRREDYSSPSKFELHNNYPNPFNPTTTISFTLPSRSFVTLKVFDIIGREVVTIFSEEMSGGTYSRQWNASTMSSGVYFYRLQAGSFTETKKLVLLK